MYAVRFWNASGECIKVGEKYHREFKTKEDALNAANDLLLSAHLRGAVEMDINNEFYDIIVEKQGEA